MSFILEQHAKELNNRIQIVREIEGWRTKFDGLKSSVRSHQMQLVLDRLVVFVDDFLGALSSQPFHRDFSFERVNCFEKILEQTMIAVLIECDRMDKSNAAIFGNAAMHYLEQHERNTLLRFWHKQNSAKRAVRSVLGQWHSDTITDMLNGA